MEKGLPKRKNIRLQNYDYSSKGLYFVTICTRDRKRFLSEIFEHNSADVDEEKNYMPVGEDLDPPARKHKPSSFYRYGHLEKYPAMNLKNAGQVAVEQLFALEKRFANIKIMEYVIMPDHIHVIILIKDSAGAASGSPTLQDVVRVFKSLTARICKNNLKIDNIFQRSYIDHVIRDMDDYDIKRKYIYENPIRWYYREKGK